MGKLITIWEFIGRHKYWITVVAFGVIIGFLDENSMIRRIGYARESAACRERLINIAQNTKRIRSASTN